MSLDAAQCYEIVKARDARFDGVLFIGVSSTGVYCRPVCRVRTPAAANCSYFSSAARAEAAGFRPCLRCRPELAPGSASVDAVERVANTAVSRIEAGALNDRSVAALADELGVSARQLHRVVEAEFGVSPLKLAQTRRLLLAKQLLTDTSLRVIDVAFASGFASVRQFNRQFKSSYRQRPLSLRRGSRDEREQAIVLKLGFREPLAWRQLIGFLAERGSSRSERADQDEYSKVIRLAGHSGLVRARPLGPGLLGVRVTPSLLPVLPELRARLRRLFDLDASPLVIDQLLRRRAELRASLRRLPGLRVPGAFDGFELSLRAVLGQQISVRAASTLFGRFVTTFGKPVETGCPGLDLAAPDAETIANASLQQLIDRGLPRRRAECVSALARATADGKLSLDPPVDGAATRAALQALPGIGPWTAEYVAMRALRDPDAFPSADGGLLRAAGLREPAALLARAEAFRPFRAYAALHLWHAGSWGRGPSPRGHGCLGRTDHDRRK